ncbi:MAG: DUF4421 family protein [Bacteroidales bacterium]|nr:DUF4421 family protein [Bacteroidales bacterium]
MKKILLLCTTFYLLCLSSSAQETASSFWKNLDSRFGLSSTKKFDTTYYNIATKGWMINLNNNFAGFLFKSQLQSNSYGDIRMNLHSTLNYQLSSTFGYRNLILGYSIANIEGNGHDFTLSLSANTWGIEFRRLETDDFKGDLQTSSLNEDMQITKSDVKIKTKYLRSYFVFNSKKYSTTAAIDERCTQKRPAGSLLFYTNYAINTITLINKQIIQRFGFSVLEYSQAELGLGYGYNYPVMQGKLLFHATLIPMFVALNSNYITDTTINEIISKNKYFFNIMGRFTINYHFNDNFGICLSAFLNSNKFTGENNLKIHLYDYLIKLSLCFRF